MCGRRARTRSRIEEAPSRFWCTRAGKCARACLFRRRLGGRPRRMTKARSHAARMNACAWRVALIATAQGGVLRKPLSWLESQVSTRARAAQVRPRHVGLYPVYQMMPVRPTMPAVVPKTVSRLWPDALNSHPPLRSAQAVWTAPPRSARPDPHAPPPCARRGTGARVMRSEAVGRQGPRPEAVTGGRKPVAVAASAN